MLENKDFLDEFFDDKNEHPAQSTDSHMPENHRNINTAANPAQPANYNNANPVANPAQAPPNFNRQPQYNPQFNPYNAPPSAPSNRSFRHAPHPPDHFQNSNFKNFSPPDPNNFSQYQAWDFPKKRHSLIRNFAKVNPVVLILLSVNLVLTLIILLLFLINPFGGVRSEYPPNNYGYNYEQDESPFNRPPNERESNPQDGYENEGEGGRFFINPGSV